MGKKKDIRGYVTRTLDKLPGIKADLVRLDDNWQTWRFPQLVGSIHVKLATSEYAKIKTNLAPRVGNQGNQ